MKLYFENRHGEKRIIAEPETEEEAMKEMYKFWEDRNFKIYYVRSWMNNDGLKVYDVGSHVEFFYLENKNWPQYIVVVANNNHNILCLITNKMVILRGGINESYF